MWASPPHLKVSSAERRLNLYDSPAIINPHLLIFAVTYQAQLLYYTHHPQVQMFDYLHQLNCNLLNFSDEIFVIEKRLEEIRRKF